VLHTAYAEKSEKINKGKVEIKADYFEEMALPIIIVLAGLYIGWLGLTEHEVEEKVKMTPEEHKEHLKKQAALEALKAK
jgi:hypothetical protein